MQSKALRRNIKRFRVTVEGLPSQLLILFNQMRQCKTVEGLMTFINLWVDVVCVVVLEIQDWTTSKQEI